MVTLLLANIISKHLAFHRQIAFKATKLQKRCQLWDFSNRRVQQRSLPKEYATKTPPSKVKQFWSGLPLMHQVTRKIWVNHATTRHRQSVKKCKRRCPGWFTRRKTSQLNLVASRCYHVPFYSSAWTDRKMSSVYLSISPRECHMEGPSHVLMFWYCNYDVRLWIRNELTRCISRRCDKSSRGKTAFLSLREGIVSIF